MLFYSLYQKHEKQRCLRTRLSIVNPYLILSLKMKINEDCDHTICIDHKERLFQHHTHEADADTLANDCKKDENDSDY